MTSSLECRAAGNIGGKIIFSLIYGPHFIDIWAMIITLFARLRGVCEVFAHSFFWGHYQLGSATASAYAQLEKVFSYQNDQLFKLILPNMFLPFCLFSF